MDSSGLELSIQRYVEPVKDMDTMPKLVGHTNLHQSVALSTFERLPLEIRQMVYSWLSYPVGGRLWTTQLVHKTDLDANECSDCEYETIHAGIAQFRFWRWNGTPLKYNAYQDIEVTLKHPLLRKQFYTCEVRGYSSPDDIAKTTKFANRSMESSLLLVNKHIYAELVSSMFGKTEIVFGFQLSDKAIHYCKPDDSWMFTTDRVINHYIGHYRMSIANRDLRHLTRITLTSLVGDNFSTNYPCAPTQISAREFLARQASSILYLADHCASLVVFKFSPNLGKLHTDNKRRKPGRQSTLPSGIWQIILALTTLAWKCERLEEIIVTPHYVEEKVEAWPRASRTTFPNSQLDQLKWTERSIRVEGVPSYLRADMVKDEGEAIFTALAEEIRHGSETFVKETDFVE
ncbi:hypothetical protein FB567DRAFT_555376 [Paraphoma chrysanthemicola]|uniref:F-box domain-containing protein n=1 Tax=Paraphoma chrysanthemicola TaxID=798071 RepID=A0A8K0VSA2_9PLEO|nr:hypothetical protein FB567DRAFT_555376 [Paraphoma chrysanthemicola]